MRLLREVMIDGRRQELVKSEGQVVMDGKPLSCDISSTPARKELDLATEHFVENLLIKNLKLTWSSVQRKSTLTK